MKDPLDKLLDAFRKGVHEGRKKSVSTSHERDMPSHAELEPRLAAVWNIVAHRFSKGFTTTVRNSNTLMIQSNDPPVSPAACHTLRIESKSIEGQFFIGRNGSCEQLPLRADQVLRELGRFYATHRPKGRVFP